MNRANLVTNDNNQLYVSIIKKRNFAFGKNCLYEK